MDRPCSKLPLPVLLLNYYPLVYLGVAAGILSLHADSIGLAIGFTLFWIYLLPPLLCRLVLAIWGVPEHGARMGSGAFGRWWLLTQMQTFFNRFPVLEECLRLFPSVYSLWLCLWGSRASPFVLWSPGVRVTDRYLLEVEARAVLGWGVELAPHLVTLNDADESQLILGKIHIGRGAIVGARATLGPGSRIGPGECFPATRILGPFHTFLHGRRQSPGRSEQLREEPSPSHHEDV